MRTEIAAALGVLGAGIALITWAVKKAFSAGQSTVTQNVAKHATQEDADIIRKEEIANKIQQDAPHTLAGIENEIKNNDIG